MWLGGTLLLLGSDLIGCLLGGWWLGTLLGPEGTPVGVVLWSAPGLVVLTQPVVALVGGVVVVAMVRCWGVVVC